MDQRLLNNYAKLIVNQGLNIDRGQEVIITAGLDQPEFLRMVVKYCYEAGAGRVVVNFTDMALAKLDQLWQSQENLSELLPWEQAKWQWMTEKLPARLWLDSDDPDGMNGINQDKHAAALSVKLKAVKPYRDKIENRHQWCIAAVPGKEWAQKLFPALSVNEAEEKLWMAIISASRAIGDPEENWKKHNEAIHRRTAELNCMKLAGLHYHSDSGTDCYIGLMSDGIFAGGSETDLSGRVFNPNIPSEEVFTSPKRGVAEGVLRATKPLSWQGNIIDDFSIRFKEGRAVEVHAKKGEDALKKLLAIDEGASYLGECALIGEDSPINQTGILFYNTLFDENACCHVALGRGFDCCLADYQNYSKEEIISRGINDSTVHVDFMIGSADLDVDGIDFNGKTIPVLRRGLWCF